MGTGLLPIQEVRVYTDPEFDHLGHEVLGEIERVPELGDVDEVRTGRVYRFEGITEEQATQIAETLLIDPNTQTFRINESVFAPERSVDIGHKPGVMDPEAPAIMEGIRDLDIGPVAVATSTEYIFSGPKVDRETIEAVTERFLFNAIVHDIIRQKPDTLTLDSKAPPTEIVKISDVDDSGLMELSKDKLFLDIHEMRVIKKYFGDLGREPTDAELEIIAARWSEHCGHKTFNADVLVEGCVKKPFIKRIMEASRRHFKDGFVLSAFKDNAGVIKGFNGYAISAKVETHNSPSAVEPEGGAMTGTGGVLRDIAGTGKGFKNVINTFMYCFAPPNTKDSDLPKGTLRPSYIARKVIKGVGDYANRMGIPTGNGSVHFHPDFRAKPTVMVGAYGVAPEKYAEQGKPQVGDKVVVIGGRTGRDGIHGATFSSGEMTERTKSVNSSAVQIGNAIEEKRMFDALILARDEGLIRAITDCGAAGFSSAVGELGEETGVTVDLAHAPLKYAGLAPWEIWLSESQERMVSAIAPENIDRFMEICEMYNVEASVLGEFDGSHTLTVNYGDQIVAELDYDFLLNGLPQRTMEAEYVSFKVEEIKPEAPKTAEEWVDRLYAVLSHGNVCSKAPIFERYDHGVQGGTIVHPFGGQTESTPNDAFVVSPIPGEDWGIVQSHGMNPILNRYDPYKGTVSAIADAASKYVSVGGNLQEAAAVGNYVWPFPDKKAMGSLDRSVDAAVYMIDLLELPVISGKDSLSSTYRDSETGEVIEIPPVYTMSVFGRIENVEKTITAEIKNPGNSTLYLVGQPSTGMAGSVYYDVTGGSTNEFPEVDTEILPKTLARMTSAISTGKVLASHVVNQGGLVATVAEMCFGNNSGALLSAESHQDPETFLFSSTAGCFVVELGDDTDAEELFSGVPVQEIGLTLDTPKLSVLSVHEFHNEQIFRAEIDDLRQVWQSPIKEIA